MADFLQGCSRAFIHGGLLPFQSASSEQGLKNYYEKKGVFNGAVELVEIHDTRCTFYVKVTVYDFVYIFRCKQQRL